MQGTHRTRTVRGLGGGVLVAALAVTAAACGGSSGSSSSTTPAAAATTAAAAATTAAAAGTTAAAGGSDQKYVVGVSNTLQGNGWREEMICSIKAQAKASGQVSKLVIANKTEGTPQQIADMRNLISAGANIIVLNPSSREALNPVIKEATDKGITVVAVDQAVSEPSAYALTNDQVAYGRVGAEWLAKTIGGKGDVVEMRGIEGVPADTDRHQGFTEALKAFPNIKVKSVFSQWSLAPTAKAIQDILNSGQNVDGVWTSGIDSTVVDAFKTANKPYKPVVGADNNKFIGQLIDLQGAGLKGAAVTNPPTVGGAGLALALKVKNGEKVDHLVKLTPEVWDQAGIDKLKAAYDPKLDPYYGVATEVKPWTTYARDDLLACKGP